MYIYIYIYIYNLYVPDLAGSVYYCMEYHYITIDGTSVYKSNIKL